MGMPVIRIVLSGARLSRALCTLLGLVLVFGSCSAKDRTSEPQGGGAGGAPSGGSGGGGASGDGGAAGVSVLPYYAMKCAICHGETGMGDGPGGAALSPKPTDFHRGSWQASVTDQHIREATLNGGAAVGKSAAMPPNPDLSSDPVLLNDLVLLIRSYYVVHKIGETAQTSSYSMVVTEAKDCQITGTFAPRAGHMKFGAYVVVTATSSAKVNFNPFYAKLTDSDGISYTSTFGGCVPELSSGSLYNPGEKAEGWITFEVPQLASKLRLHYYPFMVGVLPKELSFDLGW